MALKIILASFRVCSSRKLVKIHNTYLQLFVLSRLFSPQKIDWDKKLMAHKIVNYKKVKLQVATLCLKSINSKTALKYIFILLNKQAESHIFHILLNHFLVSYCKYGNLYHSQTPWHHFGHSCSFTTIDGCKVDGWST